MEPSDALHVSLVEGYNVFIVFCDLQCGIFDLSKLVTRTDWGLTEYFAPLTNHDFFRQLQIPIYGGGTLIWDKQCDLGTNFLYYDPDNMFTNTALKEYQVESC